MRRPRVQCRSKSSTPVSEHPRFGKSWQKATAYLIIRVLARRDQFQAEIDVLLLVED